MPKFFKKEQKIPLKVACHLTSLSATTFDENLMNKDVRVEFVRGNNERFISDTSRFKISDNEYIILFDEVPFVCTSSFFLTKKGDWREKICEFKLMVQDDTSKSKFKPLAIKKYDMSQLLNNQKELKGDLHTIKLPFDDVMTLEFQMSISASMQTASRKFSVIAPNFAAATGASGAKASQGGAQSSPDAIPEAANETTTTNETTAQSTVQDTASERAEVHAETSKEEPAQALQV